MASRERQRRWATIRTGLFLLWVGLVTLFLFLQAATYTGIMALLGEWEFNAFGRHYPTFTLALLIFLLSLPGYLLFLRPRKTVERELPEAATLRSARALMKIVFGAAAVLGMTALAILLITLFLPRESGEVQHIDLTKPMLTAPHEGPTILSGAIIYQRTAGFDENLLLARQNARFAPIVGQNLATVDLQFFVQLLPVDDRTRGGFGTVTGVLKRDGLPGEITRLFRYAGYHIEDPHYVLFMEPAVMRWPYVTTLVQFVIAGLLALAVALLQRRRLRRIDHIIHEPVVVS